MINLAASLSLKWSFSDIYSNNSPPLTLFTIEKKPLSVNIHSEMIETNPKKINKGRTIRVRESFPGWSRTLDTI